MELKAPTLALIQSVQNKTKDEIEQAKLMLIEMSDGEMDKEFLNSLPMGEWSELSKTALIAKQAALSLATLMLGNYRKVLQLLPFDCLQLGASLKECNVMLRLKNVALSIASSKSTSFIGII